MSAVLPALVWVALITDLRGQARSSGGSGGSGWKCSFPAEDRVGAGSVGAITRYGSAGRRHLDGSPSQAARRGRRQERHLEVVDGDVATFGEQAAGRAVALGEDLVGDHAFPVASEHLHGGGIDVDA
jgi:hypothetical protein